MHCHPPPYPPGPPISTVVVAPAHPNFEKHPVNLQCPYCHAHVASRVEYNPGALAWILVVVLFLIGCVFGCCLIPLCVEGCHDVKHYCPNCQRRLGTWKRI